MMHVNLVVLCSQRNVISEFFWLLRIIFIPVLCI